MEMGRAREGEVIESGMVVSPMASAGDDFFQRYAEVKYAVVRKDGAERWEEIARELPTLPIEFRAGDRALADLAADFKARFKLSLADAFAAALAKEKKAELVTGDLEFKSLE